MNYIKIEITFDLPSFIDQVCRTLFIFTSLPLNIIVVNKEVSRYRTFFLCNIEIAFIFNLLNILRAIKVVNTKLVNEIID